MVFSGVHLRFVCARADVRTFMVFSGVQVARSQKRTVVSPDPVASCLPSGLKLVDSTASAWPARDTTSNSRCTHWFKCRPRKPPHGLHIS